MLEPEPDAGAGAGAGCWSRSRMLEPEPEPDAGAGAGCWRRSRRLAAVVAQAAAPAPVAAPGGVRRKPTQPSFAAAGIAPIATSTSAASST